ncbi:MAG: hypothetical protein KKD18_03060 [Nanoarchaeota archaeon]|nr:hypothetical protein [Nanoarchaeota archaeon]
MMYLEIRALLKAYIEKEEDRVGAIAFLLAMIYSITQDIRDEEKRRLEEGAGI